MFWFSFVITRTIITNKIIMTIFFETRWQQHNNNNYYNENRNNNCFRK
jgi:hypothetical protein